MLIKFPSPLWAIRDCLARSRLTAIPYFASWALPYCKILQPQLTRARTLKRLRLGVLVT